MADWADPDRIGDEPQRSGAASRSAKKEGSVSHPDIPSLAGDPRVDALVARLADLDNIDLPAQLDVFTEVHAGLADLLDAEPPAAAATDVAEVPADAAPSPTT
jgi:hypothetical protein